MKNRKKLSLVEHRSHRKNKPEDGHGRVYTLGFQIYELRRTSDGFELLREHIGKDETRYLNVPVNGKNIWGANFSWKNAERAIMLELESCGMTRER